MTLHAAWPRPRPRVGWWSGEVGDWNARNRHSRNCPHPLTWRLSRGCLGRRPATSGAPTGGAAQGWHGGLPQSPALALMSPILQQVPPPPCTLRPSRTSTLSHVHLQRCSLACSTRFAVRSDGSDGGVPQFLPGIFEANGAGEANGANGEGSSGQPQAGNVDGATPNEGALLKQLEQFANAFSSTMEKMSPLPQEGGADTSPVTPSRRSARQASKLSEVITSGATAAAGRTVSASSTARSGPGPAQGGLPMRAASTGSFGTGFSGFPPRAAGGMVRPPVLRCSPRFRGWVAVACATCCSLVCSHTGCPKGVRGL